MATKRVRKVRKSRKVKKTRGGKDPMPARGLVDDLQGQCIKKLWNQSKNGVVGQRDVRDCIASQPDHKIKMGGKPPGNMPIMGYNPLIHGRCFRKLWNETTNGQVDGAKLRSCVANKEA